MLGSMINVVSNFLSIDSNDPQHNYWQELKFPATKLFMLYIAQSAFTFIYIHTLSCVGERIASQLRQDLFTSILQQDVSFFDSHRTGELVNRLTTDVQDFKSSFKLCLSQGLRSITQTIGCVVSLYMISPSLTLYMAGIYLHLTYYVLFNITKYWLIFSRYHTYRYWCRKLFRGFIERSIKSCTGTGNHLIILLVFNWITINYKFFCYFFDLFNLDCTVYCCMWRSFE